MRHCPFMLELGFMKVSYCGLAKTLNRVYAMLALINVSKMRESRESHGKGVYCASEMPRTNAFSLITAFPLRAMPIFLQ